ncbi:MAG: hypothetical protein AAF353_15000 [Pseudomonadota bacterium]
MLARLRVAGTRFFIIMVAMVCMPAWGQNKVVVIPLTEKNASGYEVVSELDSVTNLPIGGVYTDTIDCPRGKVPLSGGFSSGSGFLVMSASRPSMGISGFDSWFVAATNVGPGLITTAISNYVVCAFPD